MPIRRSGLVVRDEGIILPPVNDLDFQGAGVTVGLSGSKLVATIPGGGSVDWAAMGIYRPQDYGTVDPTGASDSYAAFAAARDAMLASNYGGLIVAPRGRFKIGTMLDLGQPTYDADHGWGYQHMRGIIGAGRGATTLVAASGMTDPILRVRGTTAGLPSVTIRDIGFNGNANTGMTGGVVKLQALAWADVRNILVFGATGGSSFPTYGLYVEDCLISLYDHIIAMNAGTPLYFTTGASPYTCNQTTLKHVSVSGTSWGIDIASGDNFTVEDFDCEGGAGGGIRYSAGGNFRAGGNLWFEGTYDPLFDLTASEAQIDGPNISNVTSSTNVIQNRGTGKLTVYDWHEGGTCVNASGATLRKGNSNLSGSGGTTTTLY